MEESNSSSEIIRVCRVRFRPQGPARNFLAGELELSAGDWVYVPMGVDGHPEMGQVVSVDEWTARTIPYSAEGLKKVLRKVDPVIVTGHGERKNARLPLGIILALLAILILAGSFLYASLRPAQKARTAAGSGYTQQSGKSSSAATPKPAQTPVPTAAPKQAKKKSSAKTEDPYDAASYRHPEDFYEAYRDDFWDYEDAEEYWEAHNG